MANLKTLDKSKLEKYLEMGDGYVCDFTNSTFEDCVYENTGINIYTEKYVKYSGSKANRLRSFWEKEPNHIVAKLLDELLDYWRYQKDTYTYKSQPSDHVLYNECKKIVKRLKSTSSIESIDALNPNSNEIDFTLLSQSIKESIEKNQPEHALDRLHTFVTKYMRVISRRHSLSYTQETPIHSLFGGYVKFLRKEGLIESDMSERILKSTISILEAFNKVRNSQSFAHDNPILNYNESVLIFNNISNTIRFVESIEAKISEDKKKYSSDELEWDDEMPSEEEIEAAGDQYIQYQLDRMRGK